MHRAHATHMGQKYFVKGNSEDLGIQGIFGMKGKSQGSAGSGLG
jgi:hypothetical protein